MPAAGAGRRPCCGCAKQQRRRQGEGQDDCTATRSCQGFFRVRNDIVDATFCVRRRKARKAQGTLITAYKRRNGTSRTSRDVGR